MQQVVDKWLYVTARSVHLKNASTIWSQLKIPKTDYPWLQALKNGKIYNAAAGVLDYRTGQLLAVGGSAGYYLSGTPGSG